VGKWVQYQVVNNYTTKKIKLYIDGAEEDYDNLPSAPLNDVKDRYTYLIGNNTDDKFFNGKIWEHRVWAIANTVT
jgi:hypothetical protein